jgi:hypothetical protein
MYSPVYQLEIYTNKIQLLQMVSVVTKNIICDEPNQEAETICVQHRCECTHISFNTGIATHT